MRPGALIIWCLIGQIHAKRRLNDGIATDSNQLSPLGDSYPARHKRKHKEPMKYNGKTDLEDYLGHFAVELLG